MKNNKMKMKFTLRFKFCLCLLLLGYKLFSQDLIILKNGDEIQSKVMEVLPDIIKYKKWGNQDGPVYSSNKADVFMIKYQNGTKDVFNTTQTPVPSESNGNLSRGTAEKLIKEKLHIPGDEIKAFLIGDKSHTASMNEGKFLMLQREGLLTYFNDGLMFGYKYGDLTGYGKKYAVTDKYKVTEASVFTNIYVDVRTAQLEFGEITGIIENKDLNIAEAQYTLVRKNITPFGKIFNLREGIIDEKEIFIKYDDGWRIKENEYNSYYVLPTVKIDNSEVPAPKKEETPVIPIKVGYIGDYKDGKKEGRGKMVYENGNTYEGEWKDDKKNGFGKKIYKDGSFYEGGWKDDKMDGSGTIVDNAGNKYVGFFVADERDGKGVVFDKKGDKIYECNYKNGKLNGHNITITEDDEGNLFTIEGVYDSTGRNGQGRYVMKQKDGTIATFNGEYKNDEEFNGVYTLILPKQPGFQLKQVYKNGKKGKLKKEKL